jgi:fido (protein-threonine AMPylation protein)
MSPKWLLIRAQRSIDLNRVRERCPRAAFHRTAEYPQPNRHNNSYGIRAARNPDCALIADRASTKADQRNIQQDHPQAIHRYHFQDAYDSAGELSIVSICKPKLLFPPPSIYGRTWTLCLKNLLAQALLEGLSADLWANPRAYYLGEINAVASTAGIGERAASFRKESAPRSNDQSFVS